jgi:signal transduction histidine kinase/ligand-binding sensor domain-containing protein
VRSSSPSLRRLRGFGARRIALCLSAALAASSAFRPDQAIGQQSGTAFGRYRLDVWRAQDGVRLAFTSNMVETRDGYLWLSSESGVTRFDGVRFTVFDGTNTPALRGRPRLQTVPLLEDHDGVLWIGSDVGLFAYGDGVMRSAVLDTAFTIDQVNAAMVDSRGTIWAVTRSGRVVSIPPGGTLREVAGTITSYSGSSLAVDPTGDVWIAAGQDAVYRVRDDTLVRVRFPVDMVVDDPNRVYATADSSIWFGTRTALIQMRHGRFRRVPLPSRRGLGALSCIAEAPDGTLWIGTHGAGLYRFDGERFTPFTRRDGLSDDRVIEILPDRSGNMWVATRDGLNRFRPVPFDVFTSRNGLPTDMPGAMIGESVGTMWLAPPTGGLFRGRIEGERARFVEAEEVRDYDRITALAPARGGGIWAGRLLGSVSRFVAGAPPSPPVTERLPPITELLEDTDGTLWIGTWRGLFRRRNGQVRLFNEEHGLPDAFVHRMHRDTDGTLWVATQTGIARAVGDEESRFVMQPMPNGSVNRAIVLFEAPRGTLWLGSAEGLARVTGGPPALLGATQGLPETWVGSGDEDGLGNLWLGQLGGLTRVSLDDLRAVADGREPTLRTVTTYEALDGLPGGDPGAWPHPWTFRDPRGNLWVAMGHGIVAVDPAHAESPVRPPAIHLEEVVVDGTQVPTTGGVTLGPRVRRLEVRYTGVDLSNGRGVRFRHRLDGFDTTWVAAGTQRAVSYTSLAPGRYQFRVTGRTGSGAWSAAEATLSIAVRAPLYRRAWFIGTASLLFALALYAAQRLRARRAAERIRARYQAMLAERTRLARELHDTLLQGFTGITLQLQALANVRGDAPRHAEAFAQILAVADETLRDARQMVWDMRVPELDEQDLAGALEGAARRAAVGTPVELRFTVTGDRRRLASPVETAALRIGREAVINAVRHAEPSFVAVDLVYQPRTITLSIRDDGRGLDMADAEAAAAGGHWGLRGMRERASRVGGSMTVSGAPGRGTTVLVELPAQETGEAGSEVT